MKLGMVLLFVSLFNTSAFAYDSILASRIATAIGGEINSKCVAIMPNSETAHYAEIIVDCAGTEYDFLFYVDNVSATGFGGFGDAYSSSDDGSCSVEGSLKDGKVTRASVNCRKAD